MLRGLSPRRRSLVIAVAAALVVVAAIVAWRALSKPALRHGGPVPVILVHGYGGTGASMSSLAQRLQADGREVVSVDLPEQGRADIELSAEVVRDAVDATRAADVDLVGFSAGGIVVRAYVEMLGGAERARHVVLLGTPNHGAELAGLAASTDPAACVDACAQLVPGSPLLSELNSPDEAPPGESFTSIWTSLDETVTPPESAVLDGALNVRLQDVCPQTTAGHGELVRDPLALGLTVEALGGTLDSPGPRDCNELTRTGQIRT